MTITEFLLARIAEDEAAVLERRGTFPHSVHSMDVVGSYNPRCPDCLGLPGKARVLAECAAKRAIVENAEYWNDQEFGTITRGVSRDRLGEVLRFLAPVYADHPDYMQEWAL